MTQPLPPYVLGRVAGIEPLTPLMRRITLESDDWRGAASVAPDQQVKLFLARDGGIPEIPAAPEDGSGVAGWYARYLAVPEERRPWMRSYTVRSLDPDAGRMVIDFVLHGTTGGSGPAGPASRWAAAAAIGDAVGVLGPAVAGYRTPSGQPVRLLAGDETALPAIGAILESLPAGVRAVAVVEVAGPAEEQRLTSRAELAVHWVHRPASLLDAVRAVSLPDRADEVFGWVAGEASAVRAVRRHLVGERGLDKRAVAFTGYWRADLTQDDAPTEQDLADATEQLADQGAP
ncbi:siderophore-interacting protein [Pseudonocardia sp. NPDC046786]|uniref:siderophore-interacting protein n=1 Tax=Pseudonocardia sp. NPDC046786 TaxID=3155471 RepID=UPI00340B7477